MPYKRYKDYSDLIEQCKIKTCGKHYFHGFLWDTQEGFDKNTVDNKPYKSLGCCNLAPTIIKCYEDGKEEEIIRPKLGEVHFIKDKWNMEIVAHELCHALIHRLRTMKPSYKSVIEQVDDFEENICYEFGGWVNEVYKWLWKLNPSEKWENTERASA